MFSFLVYLYFSFLTDYFLRLEKIEGDWHEFESKALRKERDREARRAAEYQKEKRKAVSSVPRSERDPKRVKPDSGGEYPPAPAGV